MAIEASEKVIPPHSKFTSELDKYDPADEEELRKRVFGQNYQTDREGNPIDASRGSDAFWVLDASLPADPRKAQVLLRKVRDAFNAHITAIRTYSAKGFCPQSQQHTFIEDADREVARINELRRSRQLPPLSI